jgi:hypothetical protein
VGGGGLSWLHGLAGGGKLTDSKFLENDKEREEDYHIEIEKHRD